MSAAQSIMSCSAAVSVAQKIGRVYVSLIRADELSDVLNSHADLVATLEETLRWIEVNGVKGNSGVISQESVVDGITAALAEAKGDGGSAF